jgi:cation diffusion facilitator family transporter
MDDCCSKKGAEIARLAQQREQRRVLLIVFAINAVMFVVEFGAGIAARSSALMADSLDMLGDASIYALSLFALSRGPRWEAGAALMKGLVILGFGVAILIELAFKLAHGIPPSSRLMLIFGAVALAANLVCLCQLWRFRRLNVNMSSTFECSRNDVISNVGVIIAAGLVSVFASPWPDVIAGAAMALIFLRSAVGVLREAWPLWRSPAPQG